MQFHVKQDPKKKCHLPGNDGFGRVMQETGSRMTCFFKRNEPKRMTPPENKHGT